MEMHPHYTEIPKHSLEAFLVRGNLSEVLLALSTDPAKVHATSRSVHDVRETQVDLLIDKRVVKAPIGIDDFSSAGTLAFKRMKTTLSQWVMKSDLEFYALRDLALWDQRFGVWCSCKTARSVMHLIDRDELRPIGVIESAESWLLGNATEREVLSKASAVRLSSYSHQAAAWAVESALAAARTVDSPRASSRALWCALSASQAVGWATRDAEFAADAAAAAGKPAAAVADHVRIREVIANACLSFPG